jgi:hypothetical protein
LEIEIVANGATCIMSQLRFKFLSIPFITFLFRKDLNLRKYRISKRVFQ